MRCMTLLLIVFLTVPCRGQQTGKEEDLYDLLLLGTVEQVKALLAKKPELVRQKIGHDTPLQIAARNERPGRKELAKALLDAGATMDVVSAAALNDFDQVKAILEKEPWLAKPPNKPLQYAVRNKNLKMVELLLRHGADPNLDDGAGNTLPYTPLSWALGSYEITKLLLEHGAKTNVGIGKGEENAFHIAISSRDKRLARLMLEHGADVRVCDNGLTPVHTAIIKGDLETVKLLQQFKADLHARLTGGITTLFFAAVYDHRPICEYLLAQGVPLDIHSACALGKLDDVAAMLKKNPELADRPDELVKRTPLFWAVQSGDAKLVKHLLGQKVNVNAQALEMSLGRGRPTLLDRSGKGRGTTPLHLAAESGNLELVKLLVESGADVHAKDGDGRSPLQCAKERYGKKKANADYIGTAEFLRKEVFKK